MVQARLCTLQALGRAVRRRRVRGGARTLGDAWRPRLLLPGRRPLVQPAALSARGRPRAQGHAGRHALGLLLAAEWRRGDAARRVEDARRAEARRRAAAAGAPLQRRAPRPLLHARAAAPPARARGLLELHTRAAPPARRLRWHAWLPGPERHASLPAAACPRGVSHHVGTRHARPRARGPRHALVALRAGDAGAQPHGH
mmetsp:Transcript_78510/g.189592  ORF Transcript_78510/g.189592 Transcript_78510/m.189592 type:complete len:200 (+) Transcript_78510:339-938(+)